MPHTIDVLLTQKGITPQQLVNESGLSAERVDAILNGCWTPSPEDRKMIAAAIGVELDDISWGHTMNPRNVRYHRFGLPQE